MGKTGPTCGTANSISEPCSNVKRVVVTPAKQRVKSYCHARAATRVVSSATLLSVTDRLARERWTPSL